MEDFSTNLKDLRAHNPNSTVDIRINGSYYNDRPDDVVRSAYMLSVIDRAGSVGKMKVMRPSMFYQTLTDDGRARNGACFRISKFDTVREEKRDPGNVMYTPVLAPNSDAVMVPIDPFVPPPPRIPVQSLADALTSQYTKNYNITVDVWVTEVVEFTFNLQVNYRLTVVDKAAPNGTAQKITIWHPVSLLEVPKVDQGRLPVCVRLAFLTQDKRRRDEYGVTLKSGQRTTISLLATAGFPAPTAANNDQYLFCDRLGVLSITDIITIGVCRDCPEVDTEPVVLMRPNHYVCNKHGERCRRAVAALATFYPENRLAAPVQDLLVLSGRFGIEFEEDSSVPLDLRGKATLLVSHNDWRYILTKFTREGEQGSLEDEVSPVLTPDN